MAAAAQQQRELQFQQAVAADQQRQFIGALLHIVFTSPIIYVY